MLRCTRYLRSLSYMGKFCCYSSNETSQRKEPFWRKRLVQTITGYNIKQHTNISITFYNKVYDLRVTDKGIESWNEVKQTKWGSDLRYQVYCGTFNSLFFISITQSKVCFVRRLELFIAFVCYAYAGQDKRDVTWGRGSIANDHLRPSHLSRAHHHWKFVKGDQDFYVH